MMKVQPKLRMEINLRTKGWGIHFDANHLYLTAIHNKLNQIQLKGHDSLSEYEARSDEEIQDFIEEFLARNGVKRGDAYMALPRSLCKVQVAEFPKEARHNLEEVMEYQLGNYFPGNLDEYEFFPQIIGESDQLKVMIVAVKKETLGHAFGLMRRWNLKLAGLTLDTFAIVNGLAKTQQDTFAKIKIVAFRGYEQGIEMISMNQGRLVGSYFFEYGEDHAEEHLMRELEQGFSLARIDPNEVDQFYWVGVDQPEWRRYLNEEVGIPFGEAEDMAGRPLSAQELPSFGAAVGTVHDNLKLGLNMLPENLRKRHKRLPVILAAVVLSLMGVFLVAGEISEFRALKKEAVQIDRRHTQVMALLTEVANAKAEYEAKQAELEMFKRYQTNGMLVKVLYALSQDLPEDTYLTNLQVKNGDQLTVQGESDDPFRTQRILSEMPFLKDVKPGNAITSGRNRDGKKRFMLKATIDLEAIR